ncbi:MAG: helix-turn-helix domain-containing protein [Vulcanimicrobiaceae bacterium]
MIAYPLDPSPVAKLRRTYGLSRQEAGQHLGTPGRYIAALDMSTNGHCWR